MTLSFGEARPEPIGSIRVPYQERAYCSDPLHPIIRRFKKMEKVAQFHILEEINIHWYDNNAMDIKMFLDKCLPIESSKLSRMEDVKDFHIEAPLNEVWHAFLKEQKFQTFPFDIKYIVLDEPNAHDESNVYCGKIAGDPSKADWDLRVTKVCSRNKVVILDVLSVGQAETFDKIRHHFKFMCEGPKCMVNWRTEWLSDVKGDIMNEILKRKQEFLDQWKTGSGIKLKFEETKDEMLPMKFDLVKNLRMKI